MAVCTAGACACRSLRHRSLRSSRLSRGRTGWRLEVFGIAIVGRVAGIAPIGGRDRRLRGVCRRICCRHCRRHHGWSHRRASGAMPPATGVLEICGDDFARNSRCPAAAWFSCATY